VLLTVVLPIHLAICDVLHWLILATLYQNTTSLADDIDDAVHACAPAFTTRSHMQALKSRMGIFTPDIRLRRKCEERKDIHKAINCHGKVLVERSGSGIFATAMSRR
jgi:hypothetical protein